MSAGALALAVVSVSVPVGGRTPRLAFDAVTAAVGIDFRHQASKTTEKYLLEAMGSGVAVFDYDNDDRLDLYFVNGAALADPMADGALPDKTDRRFHNRLYRQRRDGTFEETTVRAGVQGRGYGMGAAVGDYDNDGDADLFVTAYGGNALYRNNGDGSFADVTREAGVAGEGWSASAAFVDVDADGRLDLFVTRYLEWSFQTNGYCGERKPGYRAYCHPDQYPGVVSLLYRNQGGGRFKEIGRTAGIAAVAGKGLGVAIADYDRDGRIDVFVANDSMREFLFRSAGGGRFEEVALASGAALDQDGRPFAGMGVVFDDQNNDGWPDLLVTTLANQLYASFRNDGRSTFSYATYETGLGDLTRLHSGWGLALVDVDNDGWRDLLVAQGHVLDTIELTSPHLRYREPLLLARNDGQRFVSTGAAAGSVFAGAYAGRGLATGDLDADGRVDAVVTTLDGSAVVLRNVSQDAGRSLAVRLEGRRSNRDGIGAAIELETDAGGRQHATVSTTGSYLSARDRTVHFGLGRATVRRLTVRWPSGLVQTVAPPAASGRVTVVEGQ